MLTTLCPTKESQIKVQTSLVFAQINTDAMLLTMIGSDFFDMSDSLLSAANVIYEQMQNAVNNTPLQIDTLKSSVAVVDDAADSLAHLYDEKAAPIAISLKEIVCKIKALIDC